MKIKRKRNNLINESLIKSPSTLTSFELTSQEKKKNKKKKKKKEITKKITQQKIKITSISTNKNNQKNQKNQVTRKIMTPKTSTRKSTPIITPQITTRTRKSTTTSNKTTTTSTTTRNTKSKPTTNENENENIENIENDRPTKKIRLTKKVLSAFEEETLGIRPIDRGSSWDGNSDSLGSVNSGILDENVCFECGIVTTSADFNKVILCDVCDGEFHFDCTELTQLPRLSWTCHLCREERTWFSDLKYNIQGFQIPRRRQKLEICYSPSRPLSFAWEECLQKGFMVVKQVFSFDIMRKLTHGTVYKIMSTGRVASTWEGAINVISKQLKDSCHNIINRDGRLDIKLPPWVVDSLELNQILEPILVKLKEIMKTSVPPKLRTHNIVFAPIGSKAQSWHVDDSMRSRNNIYSYFTVLIHLNPIDDKCGGTEIWSKNLKRSDMIRPRPGDAFVFNGSLLHRGQANLGYSHRFFYYASYSCGADTNDAN